MCGGADHVCGAQGFDVDNKYGREALERVYADICCTTDGPMPDVPVRAELTAPGLGSRVLALHPYTLRDAALRGSM